MLYAYLPFNLVIIPGFPAETAALTNKRSSTFFQGFIFQFQTNMSEVPDDG
jgi:hypothetical protein